jgi:hypothetical protein
MKRTIPLLITALGGIIMIISNFVPPTQNWSDEVSTWFTILAAIAFILGGGNLLKINLRKISDRRPGWGYAAVTLTAFCVMLTVGMLKLGVTPGSRDPSLSWSGAYDQEGGVFWWMYQYVFSPLQSTMFAMLAFYVASAAFRAFRAKNVEATLLLGTAFLVLLGRTYAGALMTAWLPPSLEGLTIPGLSTTILQVFNAAGQRAIMIGIALGIVATSLKIILGIDRSYLGSDSE